MGRIKDFELNRKYPRCCMECPKTIIGNNGIRFCTVLDNFIPDDKKRMDDCPLPKNKENENG